MPEQPSPEAASPPINLKDTVLAGFLAWLMPGAGHLYQGRYLKAALYFICIMGLFLYGIYLGGSRELGWGRVVYFSAREGDQRLWYYCQFGAGAPALPALVQAVWVSKGHEPLLGGFMAPPRLDPRMGVPGNPSLHDLNRELNQYFELGTLYTAIAGLLNVLAIYDAACGPVAGEPPRKKDEDDEDDEPDDGPDVAPPQP